MTPRRLAALLLALLLGAAPAAAEEERRQRFEIRKVERLYLDDVVAGADGERTVDLFLRAETDFGEPVEHLRPVDLVVREDGDVVGSDDVSLTLLSETGRGAACVLAIDNSRTMKGEPFQQAREAAVDFVERLGSFDRLAVLAFSDEVHEVASFDSARGEARVLLEELGVAEESLGTVLYDAVHRAIEMIRRRDDLPRRAFVIVFSDGKDSGSIHTLEEVIALGQGDESRPRTPVSSIGYARFGQEGLETLQTISDRTRGEFFHASSTLDLRSFFNEIWRQMMRSYVVRFPSSMDGERHTIEVTVEGLTARRTARYPDIAGPWWPWLLGLAVLAAVAGGVAWALRAPRAGRLVFAGGDTPGRSVPVRGPRMRIGGLPENDLVISAPTVSRQHAQILVRGGRVEIEDLGSSNGTFVNGSPVRMAELSPGDKLRLGDVELVFER